MRWWRSRREPYVPSGPLSDLEPVPSDWVEIVQVTLENWLSNPTDPAGAFNLGVICDYLGHRPEDGPGGLDPVLVLSLIARALADDLHPDDAATLHHLLADL